MSNPFICTKENPWQGNRDDTRRQVQHPDAKPDDCDSDYYDCYICPNCNLFFRVELPE